MRTVTTRSAVLVATALAVLALAAAGCGSDDESDQATDCLAESSLDPVEVGADPGTEGTELTLLTHSSFALSDETLASFTDQTGIEVEVVLGADGGTLVNQAVLAAGNPVGDVLFGIDNTFLCAGLEGDDVFLPYEAAGLAEVPDALELDPSHRVTPIDFGDVCVNYWIDSYADGAPPADLDALATPEHAARFVTENPETSTPGLAFLLATIARYGEDGWEQYWTDLFENGVSVTDDWSAAYYGEFVAGGGDKAAVTSYASSPAAEVLFADPPVDEAPTGVITDTCYRQIEFAGILAGTEHPEAAAQLVEFMLSPTFQQDIPLNMFVFPANETVELPAVFAEHAAVVDDAVSLDPETVESGRNAWTERWTELWRG